MVVAAGAMDGDAKEGGANRLDHVVELVKPIHDWIGRFIIDQPQPVYSGGGSGFNRMIGKLIAGQLLANELIERRLIDYLRVTLPNSGGITEFMKIAALCETHNVGLIPHSTGPISLAALTHALGAFSGPVLMECGGVPKPPYLPQGVDFRNGKLWPRDKPGLGVEFDPAGASLLSEITEHYAPTPVYRRPDGSMTNW